MNILIVTPSDHGIGGVETVNRMLQKVLQNDGHQVSFLTSHPCPKSFFYSLAIKIMGPAYLSAKRYQALHASFDLVICNGEYAYGITHPHLINVFHGSYMGLRDALTSQLSFKNYLSFTWRAYLQKKIAKNNFVVSVSSYLKNILRHQGIQTNCIIPNAVDTQYFRPIPEIKKQKHALFVGRKDHYAKGLDIISGLQERGHQIDTIFECPNLDLASLYNQYRILVFPSRFESSGMAALEAMSCGLPVVMNDVGIGSELAAEIPEFVIEHQQKSDLVQLYDERIKLILEKEEHFATLARNYIMKHHQINDFAKKWQALVRERTCATLGNR